MWEESEAVKGYVTTIDESLEKSITGNPMARLVFISKNDENPVENVTLSYGDSFQHEFEVTNYPAFETNATELLLVPYVKVCLPIDHSNKSCSNRVLLGQGGSYTIFASLNSDNIPMVTYYETIVNANELSVFWQLPQYLLLTFAEMMFTFVNLQFAYTQVGIFRLKYELSTILETFRGL